MTTTLVGGITENSAVEVARPREIMVELRYPRAQPQGRGIDDAGDSLKTGYLIPTTKRLSAVILASEDGFIARAPEVGALGHGETPVGAIENLWEAIAEYLEYLRDDEPELAPAIAHHRDFLPLLQIPTVSWFASITGDAATLG